MLTSDDTCFACGRQNPDGLKLDFTYTPDGSKAETTFIPEPKYQGWKGIVHGGIIITLLDETMAKAAVRRGFNVLTGEITARLKNPAPVLEPLRCEAEIDEVTKKIIYARAAVYLPDGTVVAEATAKMAIVSKRE